MPERESRAPAGRASEQAPPQSSPAELGFDLHSLLAVAVRGASVQDAAAVARQLGPLQAPLTRDPDVVICFVDRVPGGGPLTFVGHEDAAFGDGEFVLMRGRHKTRVRSCVRFDRLQPGVEIVCEHGAASVPLLVPILNVVALSNGVLPLHASAFIHDGVGIVTTGWSRGGKTDALLAFAQRGATCVGDDWVYVTEDGRHVYGLPEPVRLWEWQLQSAPVYLSALERRDRARLRSLRIVRPLTRLLPSTDGFRNRMDALVSRHMSVEIPATQLFGSDHVAPDCSFDLLLLSVGHDSSAVVVEPIDPLEVAIRMSFSLRYERGQLCDAYQKFRFAFPWQASSLLERADEIERRLLRRAFAGKPAFIVRHPTPVPTDVLADAVSPYFRVVPPAGVDTAQARRLELSPREP